MTTDQIPTYNLKAVVQETGLKPDTLRAWERRYGIPEPDRTAGGHRLYSQNDIQTLKWLLVRQNEGLSISRAVKLWHRILDEGQNPLQTMPLVEGGEQPGTYTPMELGDTIVELRKSWIAACLAFDERKAEMVLSQALSYFSPETVCLELMQKALVEIGNGWYEGTVTVHQEHFASALALRRVETLLGAVPAPTRSGRILVGCPPGENHTFVALHLAFLLRRRGWDVIYLGASVPIDRLHQAVESTRPNVVVFSGQLLETAASLLDVARVLEKQNVPMAYGGRIFNTIPEIRDRIPGHFLGSGIAEAPEIIEHIIVNRPPIVAYEAVSENYLTAYDYFVERHGLVETQVWRMLADTGFPKSYVQEANQQMSQNIAAALKLGDLDFIDVNLRWLEGLLINYNVPIGSLGLFLGAWNEAAQLALGDPAGTLVVGWLQDVASTAMNEAPIR